MVGAVEENFLHGITLINGALICRKRALLLLSLQIWFVQEPSLLIFMGKDPLKWTKPLPNLQAWIKKSHLVTFLINCHTLIEVAINAKNAIFSAIFEPGLF